MRNLIIIFAITLFASSCSKVTCTEPEITLVFSFDSTNVLSYKISRYQADGNFSNLIDTNHEYASPSFNTYNIGTGYDYSIVMLQTGKIYKISGISYSGNKKATDGKFGSGRPVQCTRTLHYNLDGQNIEVKGSVFEKYYGSHQNPTITITK